MLLLNRISTQELSPLTTSLLYRLCPNPIYRVSLLPYPILLYPRVLLTQALIANSLRYTQRPYKFSMHYYNKMRNFRLNTLLFLIVYYYSFIYIYIIYQSSSFYYIVFLTLFIVSSKITLFSAIYISSIFILLFLLQSLPKHLLLLRSLIQPLLLKSLIT